MPGLISGITLILLIVVFIGIWYWAWHPKNKKSYDELAQLPLEENNVSNNKTKKDRAN